ncbi:hypothetical protein K440DRAFT_620220 [Wilcoxina mikolae CBS 423.85]|nr:hypothetical protein K440DRAFT_620220 [Wilcoxina mikolae CBS 423.85]
MSEGGVALWSLVSGAPHFMVLHSRPWICSHCELLGFSVVVGRLLVFIDHMNTTSADNFALRYPNDADTVSVEYFRITTDSLVYHIFFIVLSSVIVGLHLKLP